MVMLSVPKPSQSSLALMIQLGFLDEHRHAGEGQRADRHVDVEHPAPADVLGQPAADDRAEHRPDHHRNAEQRHRRAALFHAVDVEQDALRQRHQGGAEQALQQAEADDLRQRLREAAQHRGDHEAGDRGQQDALAAETVGEVARRRRHDGGRDDVGGQHPVDLVGAGRNAALDIGQRHVGDGRVQRLHDHGQDHAGGDGAAIGDHRCGTCRGRAGHDFLSEHGFEEVGDEVRQAARMAGVDVDHDAHAAAQRRLALGIVDRHAHRDALHDLDPVAGGVLRRQQREARRRGGADRWQPCRARRRPDRCRR